MLDIASLSSFVFSGLALDAKNTKILNYVLLRKDIANNIDKLHLDRRSDVSVFFHYLVRRLCSL